MEIPRSIDWQRMAEPQTDGYDTNTTLALAGAELGYRRREPARGEPTVLEGAAALLDDGTGFPAAFSPAPPEHPNLPVASRLIALWPAAFTQCRRLIDTLVPFASDAGGPDAVTGSTCGPGRRGFGTIACSVDNHVGLAEGLVHEMGHHKLRALGVEFETARRLVTNPPEALYPSPIRYDCRRPMTAVLHAQYSYTYVAALDVAIVAAGLDPTRDRSVCANSLAKILPKLEFGLGVLRDHARVDAPGEQFLDGLYRWSERLLAGGFETLERFEVGPVPFSHPLETASGAGFGEDSPQPATPTVPLAPVSSAAAIPDLSREHLDERAGLRPRRTPGVESYEVLDEMVLYDPDRGVALALNRSSRAVWEHCDGEHRICDIGFALASALGCGASADALCALIEDTAETASTLAAHGVLLLDERS